MIPTRSARPVRLVAAVVLALVLAGCAGAAPGGPAPSISRGTVAAEGQVRSDCPAAPDSRPARYGTVRADDGSTWPVPAAPPAADAPRLVTGFIACGPPIPFTGFDPATAPVTTVDPDGEVISGILFGDNDVQLFVNGVLVGVDPVPYAPLNAVVVRFRATAPVTYAVRLVDGEEGLGVGTERLGSPVHAGDGGFIAAFSDGTVTDERWSAQSFSLAPLPARDSVVERGPVHDTSALGDTYPESAENPGCGLDCFAAHYPVPADWASPRFDDRVWPAAVPFTSAQVGGSLPPEVLGEFTRRGARFIWSSSLVRDNLVLARTTR
ncbi:hypothetical protein [Actinomycetospora atypica]|uniref:Uncharacterized protein n=1 Tax=Actinomycetospora atypica TaxID=1290095 RepID=A0ABV9YPT6_9PSEU